MARMNTPVYQLDLIDPTSRVTAVLCDLLRLELPRDAIAVAGLEVNSERLSESSA